MAIIPTTLKQPLIKREQLLFVLLGLFIGAGVLALYIGISISKKGGEFLRFRTEIPLEELKIDFLILENKKFKDLKLPINLPIKPEGGGRTNLDDPFLPF
ncbi:MAG: hypothetical protein HYV52_02570 [Parcubacteria group bacterium]|nr:hypothetical protein [Parcubacteria group bacterium]